VNASAPSLDREVEVQSEIRKVRTFSRSARVASAALFGFGLVAVVVMLFVVVIGPIPGWNGRIDIVGLDGVTAAQLTTPALKLWAFLVMGGLTGLFLAGVYQLYRLFGNLASRRYLHARKCAPPPTRRPSVAPVGRARYRDSTRVSRARHVRVWSTRRSRSITTSRSRRSR
jgi:hypothetical protein